MTRRAFLRTAAGLLVAAPAIVRASSLMPVRAVVDMRDIVFPQLPQPTRFDAIRAEMLRLFFEFTEASVERNGFGLARTGWWIADELAPCIPGGQLDRLVFRRHLPLRLTQRPNPSET